MGWAALPAATLATIVLALCACTVVRDEPAAQGGQAASPSGFDASRVVDGMWDPKVLPFFAEKAVDVTVLWPAVTQDLDAAGQRFGHRPDTEGSPWSFPVKGRGRVVEAHTESRAGTLVVAVGQGAAEMRVTLQIGPVVIGNAIRDGLPFVRFGDVKNQIEFAQLGRALNDRALRSVRPALGGLEAPGTVVQFTGATSISSPGDDLVIMPVSLAGVKG